MPILVSPATLSDGTDNHIYTLQNQIQVGKSVVSTYLELAAAASAASTLKTKYDASSPTLFRNVAQVNYMLPIADGSLKLATFNISGVFHKQHVKADLIKKGKIVIAAAAVATFWDNFINQI
jgi:hypothetical protein